MKKIIFLFALISLFSCSPETYTSSKYFNCPKSKDFNPTTEKQQLIFDILNRATVELKDITDYGLLKDKKNIYINRTYYSRFSAPTKADIQEFQFEDSEIPAEIKDVRYCLKSQDELQKIANETSDFVYLTFGNIEFTEDLAQIGLATGWQSQTNSKKMYLSGGGYVLQYKKVDGKWVFDKILKSWIS